MGATCLQLLEKDIQKLCIDYLKVNRWMVLDFSRHEDPDIAGVADIYALKKGRGIWIEFKRPGNKQQDNQIEFEDGIKGHGGEYVIIKSLNGLMEYLQDEKIQGKMF